MRDSGVVRVFAVFRDGRGGVLAEANADAGAEGCPGMSAGGERALGAAGCGTAAGMNPTEALVLSQVVLSFGIPFALWGSRTRPPVLIWASMRLARTR
jgi:hypothetical protein